MKDDQIVEYQQGFEMGWGLAGISPTLPTLRQGATVPRLTEARGEMHALWKELRLYLRRRSAALSDHLGCREHHRTIFHANRPSL